MTIPKLSLRSLRNARLILSALVLIAAAAIIVSVRSETPKSAFQQNTSPVHEATNLLASQWSYMPGVNNRDGILDVTRTGRVIVNQDGSGGQPNPAINVYGAHLENAYTFGIEGLIQKRTGSASIQLYGAAPIIADEFRVERQSVRLTFTDSGLRLTAWGADYNKPVLDKPFTPAKSGSSTRFKLSYEKNTLSISVNDKFVTTMDARDIFTDGSVWLGLDGSEHWQLAKLDATANGNDNLVVADSSTLSVKTVVGDGLQQLASHKRPGFTVGAAMALGPLATDAEYAEVALGGNFGSLTTENALKWQFVHPQPDQYNFQEADALVALASRHHMSVHGHPLVFGEANPPWVRNLPTTTQSDRDKIKSIMRDHIATVVGHYKGKVTSWDVINEPLGKDDPSQLRNHIWYRAMGEQYIAEALRSAHQADPKAKLFINEWGLEMDDDRWDALISLLDRLQRQKVPIDGVGFQAHIYHRGDKIDPMTLRERIKELADRGLVSRVSEIDVYSYDGDIVQAMQYANILEACVDEPSCVGYTTWGISDRYNFYKDDDGSIQSGQDFLWTADMNPTPAVKELQRVLTKE